MKECQPGASIILHEVESLSHVAVAIVTAQVVDAVSVSTISLLERGVVPLDIFDVKFHVLVSPTEREIVYADVVRASEIMEI